MSFEHPSMIHEQLVLGNSLLGDQQPSNSPYLFVSLSELIAESVFYHPTLVCSTDSLSELEKSSLDAILGGLSIEEHFVNTLVTQIEQAITAQQHIRVALSHADSHDFQALIGGSVEKSEVNPAIGLRGVARYASNSYAAGFALECKVIKTLRDKGHDIEIVVPFVRTLSDAATIIDRLAEQGLPRGLNGLKVSYTCNVPSAALLADAIRPECRQRMIAAHRSTEPAQQIALQQLGLKPMLDLQMRLGEGTGGHPWRQDRGRSRPRRGAGADRPDRGRHR